MEESNENKSILAQSVQLVSDFSVWGHELELRPCS